MGNKKRFPYDKVLLALFGVLVVAVLLTPSVTGYVTTGDLDHDRDIKMCILIENTLVRMDRKGEISLVENLSSAEIEEKLNEFFGVVVKPTKEGTFYAVHTQTGKTFVREVAAPGEVLLNQQ
jgi:predicted nucleotidyltransferase